MKTKIISIALILIYSLLGTQDAFCLAPPGSKASSIAPLTNVDEQPIELLPGAEQAIELIGDSKEKATLLIQQENNSEGLLAPIGLEIETNSNHDHSNGILTFEIVSDYLDVHGKHINAPDLPEEFTQVTFYEYRTRPSWSTASQLAIIEQLMRNGLKREDVISAQVNIGMPYGINITKDNLEFVRDIRLAMLMVVLTYVSDNRILNKKSEKTVLAHYSLDENCESIAGYDWIRVEYGFSDIENLDTIVTAIHHLHAVIYSKHIPITDAGNLPYNLPLKKLFTQYFTALKNKFTELNLISSLNIIIDNALTYESLIKWRNEHPHTTASIRNELEQLVTMVGHIYNITSKNTLEPKTNAVIRTTSTAN